MTRQHPGVAELGVQFGDQLRPAAVDRGRFESPAIGGDSLRQPATGLVRAPDSKMMFCERLDLCRGFGAGGNGRRGHGGSRTQESVNHARYQ